MQAPEPGEKWPVQFMRTRVMPHGQREHSTWSMTEKFHDLGKFGTVEFE